MRFVHHVAHAEDRSSHPEAGPLRPASLLSEGFVHGSFAKDVRASAALYFPAGAKLVVHTVDPRRLDVPIVVADTPRGPMPHVHGEIPRDAIVATVPLEEFDEGRDAVLGSNVVFLAFPGMTLLDLVATHDAVARIRRMGFDPTTRVRIVGVRAPEPGVPPWTEDGARFDVEATRPSLADVDALIVPGGPGATAIASDPDVLAWLATYPTNRFVASVCTGASILGAMGRLRGKRATTHATAMHALAAHGAEAVSDRVVSDGATMTAGGVTAGIDLGLAIVERLLGTEVRRAIATQMNVP